jgi:hypothetical protein
MSNTLYYGLVKGKLEYGFSKFEGSSSIELSETGSKTVYVIKGETYYGDHFKSIVISESYEGAEEEVNEMVEKHFGLYGYGHPESSFEIESEYKTNTENEGVRHINYT